MKLWRLNLGKMSMTKGLALGAGAVILTPIVLPVVGGVLKSLTKAAIKGGIIILEQGKVIAAETRETFEDMTAEARAEIKDAKKLEAPAKKKSGK